MRLFVSVTDKDWFDFLKNSNHTEINFWHPGGKSNFKALTTGEMLLFKLHSPLDYIVGGGFFLNYSIAPASVAWSAYGTANGTGKRMIHLRLKEKFCLETVKNIIHMMARN
ncbi:MAG: hypothetical protein LBN22_07365 [Clostridiales Family XIII bacterium]|jgi:putative restriction endonuclease|nr:hypothetical protein [Clostridiales Family XIII bacterium]